MILRFTQSIKKCTNPQKVLLDFSNTCKWCGFQSENDSIAYQEEDNTDQVACTICFNARHVLQADPKRYTLSWFDEIDQTELSNLIRVIAVTLVKLKPYEGSKVKHTLNQRFQNAKEIFKSIKQRAIKTNQKFEGQYNQPLLTCWKDLDIKVQEKLLPGLRLFPLVFEEKEIGNWVNNQGSLWGYGITTLNENNWFESNIGLKQIKNVSNSNQSFDDFNNNSDIDFGDDFDTFDNMNMNMNRASSVLPRARPKIDSVDKGRTFIQSENTNKENVSVSSNLSSDPVMLGIFEKMLAQDNSLTQDELKFLDDKGFKFIKKKNNKSQDIKPIVKE